MIESTFQIALFLATLFCTLVTGILLVFAIVVMPGIGTLDDGAFLRAFQVMDRVIQNNQPLFLVVWGGSVVALLVATALGVGRLEGVGRFLIISAAVAYIVGTQLPTFTVNIPLNNRVQTLTVETLDDATQSAERRHFEARWNRWNAIRTAFAGLVSVLLLILLRLV